MRTDERENALFPSVELLIPVYRPGVELAALLERMGQQTVLVEGIHLLVTAREEEFEELRERYTRFWRETEGRRGRGGEKEGAEAASAGTLRFTRIAPEEFDHGGTRHLGASQSRADVLLFMTQDAVPADEYLVERLLESLGLLRETASSAETGRETEMACAGQRPGRMAACAGEQPGGMAVCAGEQPEIAAVYARQLPAADCNVIERFTRAFNYPDESRIKTAADLPALGIKTFFCSNVCAAYRRDVYEKQGGFIRHTIFNEDMIFAAGLIKAGYGVAYAAGATVVHSHNYSGLQQLHRNFDLAVSQADHPEAFEGIASEGEGIRMVKAAAAHLCGTGRFWLLPKLFWQSGCKYMGYLLGRRYRRLPAWLIRAITMNQRYWNHEREV